MGLETFMIPFLLGFAMALLLTGLAKGEIIDFFRNLSYFGFIFRNGDFATMYNMKPTPEEEPKEETLLDEKSGEHTAPGDEPKEETISDEVSGEEITLGDEPKEETISDEVSGEEITLGDEPKEETMSYQESGEEITLGDEPKEEKISDEVSGEEIILGDEPEEETISDEECGEETIAGDEPEEETISDEECGEETIAGDEPEEETISDEECGEETIAGHEPKEDTISNEESKDETNPSDKPKNEARRSKKKGKKKKSIGAVIGTTVGAGVALVGLPAIFGALGLTGVGIAAGSVAAKMIMGADGDVAEDGEVAVLQTIGSTAYSLAVKTGLKTALRSVSAGSGDWLSKWKKTPSDKPKETTNIQVTNPKEDKTQVTNPRKSNLGGKHEEKTTPDKQPKRSQAAS